MKNGRAERAWRRLQPNAAEQRAAKIARGMSDADLLAALDDGDVLPSGPLVASVHKLSDDELLVQLAALRELDGEGFTVRPPVPVEADPVLAAEAEVQAQCEGTTVADVLRRWTGT